MAATGNKIAYAAGAQITCSLASLASGSTRESNTVANTTNFYFDYLVAVTFTIASGTPSTANPCVNVYANGSNDATLWPIIQLSSGAVKATGTGDQSIGALGTGSISQLRMIGTFAIQSTTSASERTFRTPAFSVAQGFSGTMPPAYSIFVENQTGVAFSTSTVTTANYVQQSGVYTTSGN